MLAWAFSSSILQPLFGLWSDRRGAIWLLPAGLALGGLGIGLAAVAPSYWLCLALITLSGLGTAAYHPKASKFAAYVSGRRRASGMSLFSIGGNLGYALGPIVATFLVVHFGLEAGLLLALPCLVVAAVLLLGDPATCAASSRRAKRCTRVAGEDRLGAMVALLGVIAFRSVAWFGLITFVPLYEVSSGQLRGVRQPAARGDAALRRDRDAARRPAGRPPRPPARARRAASSRPARSS